MKRFDRDKRGWVFAVFIVLGTFVALTYLTFILLSYQEGLPGKLGQKQADMINISIRAEEAMLFLDMAAKDAYFEAAADLAENGGFGLESACGDYNGYNLWNCPSHKDAGSFPIDAKTELAKIFDERLMKALYSYRARDIFRHSNFEYSVDENNHVLGKGINKVFFLREDFAYGFGEQYVPLAIGEERIDAGWNPAGVGREIAKAAEDYADKLRNLDYVRGGVSPYPYAATKRDQDQNPTTFFIEGDVFLHQYVPDGEFKGMPMPQGFDCSGFVWYVYRHFGLIKDRKVVIDYYADFSDSAIPICDNRKNQPCTRDSVYYHAQPGDLLFINDQPGGYHIAIYAGDGNMVHSSSWIERLKGIENQRGGIEKTAIPSRYQPGGDKQIFAIYRLDYAALKPNADFLASTTHPDENMAGKEGAQEGHAAQEGQVGGEGADVQEDKEGSLAEDEAAENNLVKKWVERVNTGSSLSSKISGSDGRSLLSDCLVLALMDTESGGIANAESHKGAKGLIQVMPLTAKDTMKNIVLDDPGLLQDFFVFKEWKSASQVRGSDIDLNDPDTNLMIGIYYFSERLAVSKQKLSHLPDSDAKDEQIIKYALAQYNAGPNKVMEQCGEDGHYIDFELCYPQLYEETKGHNDKTAKSMQKCRAEGFENYYDSIGGISGRFISDASVGATDLTYSLAPAFNADIGYDFKMYDVLRQEGLYMIEKAKECEEQGNDIDSCVMMVLNEFGQRQARYSWNVDDSVSTGSRMKAFYVEDRSFLIPGLERSQKKIIFKPLVYRFALFFEPLPSDP